MADIGSLIVKIGADASGLQKAFSDLGGSARQFQRGLETIGKIASTAFLAAATSAVAMTIAAGKQAEELDQLAAVTGINTDKLQEYDVVLTRAGLSGQDLATIMKNVSNSLDQARRGTGTAGDRFRQLGIDIRTVTSTDDLIRKIATSTGKFADGTGKAAIMSDLMGKSWQQFMKAFQGGEAAFNGMAKASQDLGAILTTSQIDTLKDMDDKIDDVTTAYKRFGQQLGVSLAPNIKMISELLINLMVVGANHAAEFGLAWDVLGTKVLHFGLQISELSDTLFSSKIFSAEAWKKTLESIRFIGGESDKQVARLRAAFELAKTVAPLADKRKAPPEMIDTAQASKDAQALADAQLKADQDLFRRKDALAQAHFALQSAHLARNQAEGITSDIETAQKEIDLMKSVDLAKARSLTEELENYRKHSQEKLAMFTNDQKGQADRLKFETESAGKIVALEGQIEEAGVKSSTNRIVGYTKLFQVQQKHALDSLEAQTILADSTQRNQEALYQQEASFIGAADAARQVAFEAQERRYDLDRAQLEQSLELQTISYETYIAKVMALEQDLDTKRRNIVSQYPTFVEQQLQSIVASNAFSLSSIVTTWTSAISTMILHGGSLRQAWEATQQAILQSTLNALVQMSVQWALAMLKEQAVADATAVAMTSAHTAMETAKTAITTAAATARTVTMITAAKVGGAAALGEIAAIGTASIGVLQAIVVGIAGVFAAMGAALAASIVGSPFAPGMVAAGAAALGAGTAATGAAGAAVAGAIAAGTAALALAEGGLVSHPTMALIGERGPEAVIPLNQMGGLGGETTIVIQLDGREMARNTMEYMPGIFRMKTGYS